jgi:hypothetical protein
MPLVFFYSRLDYGTVALYSQGLAVATSSSSHTYLSCAAQASEKKSCFFNVSISVFQVETPFLGWEDVLS